MTDPCLDTPGGKSWLLTYHCGPALPFIQSQCRRNFNVGDYSIQHEGTWAQVSTRGQCNADATGRTAIDNMLEYNATLGTYGKFF